MKKKDLVSLREKDINTLKTKVIEKKKEEELTLVRIYAGQEKNLKKAFLIRREIAQILTIIREKEIIENEVQK
ncbi:MAG: 50S ribosomal protein L29 [Patescibacteria group bacterium]